MGKLINNLAKPQQIQVAVGIVTNTKGQFLIAKRPAHWLGGGFWEFPGGKLELNEDSRSALCRELLEEVGIVVKECVHLLNISYTYPEREVSLDAWRVESYSGEAAGLEGQEISWQDLASLNDINMLPANQSIIKALQTKSRNHDE